MFASISKDQHEHTDVSPDRVMTQFREIRLKKRRKGKKIVPAGTQNALNLMRDRVNSDITQKLNLA
jgi:hypothetical protein